MKCQDLFSEVNKKNEPKQTYNKTRAAREDSDQPVHPHSLIRVFTDHMCLVQSPGYLKRDRQEPLPYCVNLQTDLSICWSHRSYSFIVCLLKYLRFKK